MNSIRSLAALSSASKRSWSSLGVPLALPPCGAGLESNSGPGPFSRITLRSQQYIQARCVQRSETFKRGFTNPERERDRHRNPARPPRGCDSCSQAGGASAPCLKEIRRTLSPKRRKTAVRWRRRARNSGSRAATLLSQPWQCKQQLQGASVTEFPHRTSVSLPGSKLCSLLLSSVPRKRHRRIAASLVLVLAPRTASFGKNHGLCGVTPNDAPSCVSVSTLGTTRR